MSLSSTLVDMSGGAFSLGFSAGFDSLFDGRVSFEPSLGYVLASGPV